MTSEAPARRSRSPIIGAAALFLVILLFGAVAFVAGLNVAGVRPAATGPSVSAQPTTEPEPEATPELEVVTCTAPTDAFQLLCDTYARIKADYVDEVDDAALVEGAVDGMVDALPDPYSGYLPPEQYQSATDDLSGEFSGIGAEVGVENLANPDDDNACTTIGPTCALVIISPLDGSPAEAARLQPGDQVLAVDGESTAGETIQDAVFRVRGEAGTDVELSIRRDERDLSITVTRAVIELQVIETRMLDGGVGYIRLSTFTDDSTELFRAGLESLLADGARSIVFDLRNNPGGFIDDAQGVAGQFIADGVLFTVESGENVDTYEARGDGVATDPSIEVVVLVNEGSASASEIVAGALKERGRATLVGQPTFGKNTVQTWSTLPNEGGLRITIARWFTPDHNTAEGDGLAPDVLVAEPADPDPDSEVDPILDRAVELLGE